MTLSEPQTMPGTSIRHTRRFVHIRELDGIRGIAALMLFFHHLCFTSIDP
jgi:peptidoglycan/LPS O-acetylase OafA/YrhL